MFSEIHNNTLMGGFRPMQPPSCSSMPVGTAQDSLGFNHVDYFYLLRHSKTTWQKEQLKEGFIDSSLNERGIAQSQEASKKLSPDKVKIIVSSSLKRCTETAEIISQHLDGRPVIKSEGIVSRDYGSSAYEAAGSSKYLSTVPSEDTELFKMRVIEAVSNHLKEWGNGVLFVSHGCVEGVVIDHLLTEKESLGSKAYGCPILFERRGGVWTAQRIVDIVGGVLSKPSSSMDPLPHIRVEPTRNTFYFLRHGRTSWNKEMIHLGPQDLSLNEEGISEVTSALAELSTVKITRIVTSLLHRCVESSEIISKQFGGISIIIEPQLKERYFGDWSLKVEAAERLKSMSSDGPSFFASIKHEVESMLPQDAEEHSAFEDRIIRYLNTSVFNPEGENTLIVAHGCVRDVLLSYMDLSDNRAGPKQYGKPLVFEPKNDGSWSVHPLRDDDDRNQI